MNFSQDFKNTESLLRGINKQPNFWDSEENRPTSAAFKDKKGVSVNRTGENKQYYVQSLECLKNKLGERLRSSVELNVDFCIELGLHLKYCPLDDNIYHSEIHKSENEPSLTKSVSRKLSEICNIIN